MNVGRIPQLSNLPRVKLAHLPTPLHEAKRLSGELGGPRIFIKRDDLTGLGFGGNKARILEFIMGDAVSKGSDVIVTGAGWHSNWCTQVLAACRRLGLDVVIYKQAVEDGYDPEEYDGNHLLHFMLGARMVVIGHPWDEKAKRVKREILEKLESEGRKPYDAGESPYQSIGYVNGVLEMLSQTKELGVEVDYIVHATASGMTQSGLILGVKALNMNTEVIGISISPGREREKKLVKMVDEGAKILNLDISVSEKDVRVINDYVGEGYAVVNDDVIRAMELVAKTEGIFLDPVYTGKAMAGLIEMIRDGRFSKNETLIFLHTGGTPAIFPYRGPIKSVLKNEKAEWLKPPWYYKEG
ncbi:MAG: D-cysteine desulfhydrase family protein [Candidatus Bathyarchaeia archaeon]